MEILIAFIFLLSLGVAATVVVNSAKEQEKRSYERGLHDGMEVKRAIGEEKAKKVAGNLPKGYYRKGFENGIEK